MSEHYTSLDNRDVPPTKAGDLAHYERLADGTGARIYAQGKNGYAVAVGKAQPVLVGTLDQALELVAKAAAKARGGRP